MFTLKEVIPWGRSFDEYRRMFDLTDADFRLRILGCADGPASFNAEATRCGHRVVSCDPLYRCQVPEIRNRIDATYEQVLEQTRQNRDEFVWQAIPSLEALGRVRMSAMEAFLEDFEAGRTAQRYLDAELPVLPFSDGAFDLAVCSHFLFLYSDQLGEAFHHEAVLELCRVAPEVRIFPVLALGGRPSPFLPSLIRQLRDEGHQATLERVPYEFQRGGNEMMRIRAQPI
jgi:hypothetical protein